jgi:hypothetical protein
VASVEILFLLEDRERGSILQIHLAGLSALRRLKPSALRRQVAAQVSLTPFLDRTRLWVVVWAVFNSHAQNWAVGLGHNAAEAE